MRILSKNLPPVSEFLVYRSGPDKSGRLLLGMGDNFGPEFGASLQLENASGSQCYQTPTALQDKRPSRRVCTRTTTELPTQLSVRTR